jgi:hypothetical protein
VTPDIQQAFLKHVIHVVFIPDDAADHSPQQRVMALIQSVKAPLILTADAGHQLFVGRLVGSIFEDSFELMRFESVEHGIGPLGTLHVHGSLLLHPCQRRPPL